MRKTLKEYLKRAKALRAAIFNSAGTPSGGRGWHGAFVRPLSIVFAVARDVFEGQITLRAMSLVYTTLLSLVPLIAISFSVLKAFGVHNRAEPILLSLLEPLGEKAGEITERIIGFVDNVQVGVLGFIGLLLLFYTVVSLLEKVERAFNYIWHVPNERPLSQKVRDYLALVVLGPVALIGAIGATSSILASSFVQDITSFGPVSDLVAFGGRFVTLFMVSIAFTFLYMFIPNTHVRFVPALIGGIAAGFMWTVTGWGFASFIATSVRYAAIYSAFATLILFMIWLYVVWLIVLIGSAISFYLQSPHYIGLKREFATYSIETRERAALTAVWHIVRAFYRNAAPWTAEALARRTGMPMPVLCEVLDRLEDAGLIERAGERQDLYLPNRPPEETPVDMVRLAVRRMESIRLNGEDTKNAAQESPPGPDTPKAVSDLMQRIDGAVSESLSGITLKEFALTESEAPAPAHLTDRD